MLAPLAVKVTGLPAQTDGADAAMLIDGGALTRTETVADRAHPNELVPVTAYDVLTDGLTAMEGCVPVVLQTYNIAPLAVRVVVFPKQIAVFPVIAIVGTGFTYTVTVDVFEQVPAEPVTV